MKYLTLLLLFALFSGCTENEKPLPQKMPLQEIVLPTKPKKEPEISPDLITNENVTERLLAYGNEHPETIVKITTDKGAITVRLFKDTPLHRANFIMMANKHYFDSTIFSRVVPKFMAQGGSAFSYKHTDLKRDIGDYTIPAEFSKTHFHKKGAFAMAREYNANPDKRSSPYVFYFVEGTTFSNETLDIYEEKNSYKYTQIQRDYYTKKPGAAHIDGEHTVFGEIINGFEVVPKLTAVDRDRQDWPRRDLFIQKVEVIK